MSAFPDRLSLTSRFNCEAVTALAPATLESLQDTSVLKRYECLMVCGLVITTWYLFVRSGTDRDIWLGAPLGKTEAVFQQVQKIRDLNKRAIAVAIKQLVLDSQVNQTFCTFVVSSCTVTICCTAHLYFPL